MTRIFASRELLLLIAIGALLGLIASRFPAFVAPANLIDVFNDTSPLILLAVGQMIVILTRCIDLSVAANLLSVEHFLFFFFNSFLLRHLERGTKLILIPHDG